MAFTGLLTREEKKDIRTIIVLLSLILLPFHFIGNTISFVAESLCYFVGPPTHHKTNTDIKLPTYTFHIYFTYVSNRQNTFVAYLHSSVQDNFLPSLVKISRSYIKNSFTNN